MKKKVNQYLKKNKMPNIYDFAEHYKTTKACAIASAINPERCYSSDENGSIWHRGKPLLQWEQQQAINIANDFKNQYQ